MKFSFRQILASAAGAVIAALIASSFGVTGTIVGVAIGSMAATMGTALVSQSIERGQKVVKQAVVRVPDGSPSVLLRRMGGTGAAGEAASSIDSAPPEAETRDAAGSVAEEATEMVPGPGEPGTPPLLPTTVLAGAGLTGVTEGEGVARAASAEVAVAAGGRRFSWKAFAGTAAVVFLLALGLVTAIELIVNRPSIITPSSPASSTTTTSTPSTTTSTSAPASSTTTSSTAVSSTTTSTTSAPGTTTTNPTARSTTTTSSGITIP